MIELALEYQAVLNVLGEEERKGFKRLFGEVGSIEAFRKWSDLYKYYPAYRKELSRLAILVYGKDNDER